DFWVFNSWNNKIFHLVQILSKIAKKGIKIVYLPGNHDEEIRNYLPLEISGLTVVNEYIYTNFSGKKFLVVHGDIFDFIIYRIKWLAHFGSYIYDHLLSLNLKFNWIRKKLGLKYWSLSAFLKRQTKSAQNILLD